MNRILKSLEEADEITAVRLTTKRQRAKVGDIFRLSPTEGVVLWGRLVKRDGFFGETFPMNLIYIYDVISTERPPAEKLVPSNLLIGPCVVNNLGWSRGYWETVASEPVIASDLLDEHLFIRFRGFGGRKNYNLVNEKGEVVMRSGIDISQLSQSGFGNFNSVDFAICEVLRRRGDLPSVA